jgi:hypothetical protein
MTGIQQRSFTAGLWFIIGGVIIGGLAAVTNESIIYGQVLFFS